MRQKVERHLGLLLGGKSAAEISSIQLAHLKIAERDEQALVPPEFTPHRYAIFLLHIAAEIEHALMVEYLYAAFSLGGPQVPAEHSTKVAQWREIILGIAKEEMGHLMTVQNLLRCLGGPLNVDRDDFPWDSDFIPFPFMLEPLTRQSLAKYVYAESPFDWSGSESDEVRSLAEQGPGANISINQVGRLYNAIEKLLADEAIKDSDFRASTFPYQANLDEWGRGYSDGARGNSTRGAMAGTPNVLLLPVTARTDAIAALQAVATQGEANPKADDASPSHFARFLRIFRQFPKDGGWSPARNVPINPFVTLTETRQGGRQGPWPSTPITHPETSTWAHLFNVRYEALLINLLHTFEYPNSLSEASQVTPRGLLLHATFGEMYNIRALSEILMQMPLAFDAAERLAGPPFQVPYTLKLPVDPIDRWRSHLDILRTGVALAEHLFALPNQRYRSYLRAMIGADRESISVVDALLNQRPVLRETVSHQY
jgi:hypothetical protein